MRILTALGPVALAIVVALTAFAVPAAAQPATLPTWQIGQEVAYGVTVPIGQEAGTAILYIKEHPGDFNITHLTYLNLTGSFDSWVYQQVTMKTDSAYVLHSLSASGLKLHFSINATFDNLPRAGTYTGSASLGTCIPPSIPVAAETTNVTLDLTSLETTDGTTNYRISDLALQNDTTNATTQVRASAFLYHVPSLAYNDTACTITVTYRTQTLGLTVDTRSDLATLYSPALDFFHFPISDNETWWANSSLTFAGSLTGTVDVQGLSSQDEHAFFENLTQALRRIPSLAVTGLDHFPIDLSQVAVQYLGVSVFDHGRIHQTPPQPLNLHLKATQTNLYLSDHAYHEAFEIYRVPDTASALAVCPPAFAALYSPTYPAAGQGMIVGYSLLLCPGTGSLSLFELENTPPATGRANIQHAKEQYQVFPPAQGNALVDFFTQAPYWGLLLVVAVAALVVGVLVMRRRRRPAAVPPGMPQAPPPPPPSAP